MTVNAGKESLQINYVSTVSSDDDSSCGGRENENKSQRRKRPQAKTKTKKVSLCGIDPDLTSHVFRQVYALGAATVAKPPTTIEKPQSDEDLTLASLPTVAEGHKGGLCGMDPILSTVLEAGAATVMHPAQVFDPPSSSKSKETHERRVLHIAKDLKKVAPELVKKENLVQVLKSTRQKQRKKNREQSGESTRAEYTDSGDDDASSAQYPSDIDEFLDYAKQVVAAQNASFDSDSFRDFESVLQLSIRNHFVDDDDDNDSMTSVSTFSGYAADTKSRKKLLQDNHLMSESCNSRLKGSIAKKKLNNQGSGRRPSLSKRSQSFRKKEDASAFTSDPSSIPFSDDEDTYTVASATTAWTEALSVGRSWLKALQDLEVQKDDSQNPLSEMNVSGFSPHRSFAKFGAVNDAKGKALENGKLQGVRQFLSTTPQRKKDEDSDSDNTVQTGASWTAINKHIKKGNTQVLEKYLIDVDDNSVVSMTPYEESNRVVKRRFRKKRVHITADDALYDNPFPANLEQTIDDLAYILAKGKSKGRKATNKHNNIDPKMVLKQLESVAPNLHREVVARMQNKYASGDPMDRKVESSSESDERNEVSTALGSFSAAAAPILRDNENGASSPEKVYWADKSIGEDDVARTCLSPGKEFLEMERKFISGQKEKVLRSIKTIVPLEDSFDSKQALTSQYKSVSADGNHGRALIHRLQRKRKALVLARQRQQQFGRPGKPEKQREITASFGEETDQQTVETPESPSQLASLGGSTESESRSDGRTPEKATTDVNKNGSPVEATRNVIQRVRARRKALLKNQIMGKSKSTSIKKALHESMDASEQENEDTVQGGSEGTKVPASPKQGVRLGFRKKPEMPTTYEVLSENNSSFDASPNFKSPDILQALSPPSPESPISVYRQSEDEMDHSGLFAVASGEVSTSTGRRLAFGDENNGRSKNSKNPFDDPFNEIVIRTKKYISTSPGGETFVNIHKETSPTSIADFFSEAESQKKHVKDHLAFVDDQEQDVVFVDDDDRDMIKGIFSAFADDIPEGIVEPNFISSTQFEV